MHPSEPHTHSPAALRERAVARLGHDGTRSGAAAALGVLHALAASPATAGDALALLHELQVHQVELDVQDEELRAARLDLERELVRRSQLYEHAAAGALCIDAGGVIHELNAAAARLLGGDRAGLPGRRVDSLLAPRSADALHTLLARTAAGHVGETCPLHLAVGGATLQAAAERDPGGSGFLLALMDRGETPTPAANR